jgi:MFS family permease
VSLDNVQTLGDTLSALKKHYELVISACCFLILFTNVGLASTSFSVYQSYIVEIDGVGHTGGSMVLVMRTFVSLLCMFVVAKYYEKLNCRLGVLVGCLCTAAGFLVFSFSNSLVPFCIGAALAGAGYGLSGTVASTLLIGRWFHTRVGTASGIAAVGSGVAGIVVPPVAAAIIDQASLSAAFGAESILAAALGVILFLLVRNTPYEMGLMPYGTPASEVETFQNAEGVTGKNASDEGETGVTGSTDGASDTFGNETCQEAQEQTEPLRPGDVLSPVAMIPMYIAAVCVGAVSIVAAAYLGVLFRGEGFSATEAAELISISGIALTVAKLTIGYFFDKFGSRVASGVFFILFIIGLALCCVSGGKSFVFAAAASAIYGLGLSLGSVGISVWSLEMSPGHKIMKTIRNFQVAYVFGGFAFNFVPGFLAEASGSYVSTYAILLCMTIVSAVIVQVVYGVAARRLKSQQV